MSFFYKAKNPQILASWLAVFLFAELFSWLAFNFTFLSLWFLLLVFALTIFLGFLKEEYLLFIPLAELFWGSLGHSFDYQGFGLRLFIFGAIILVFFFKNILRIKKLRLFRDKGLLLIFSGILFFLIASSLVAYFNGHLWQNIFFDINAYLYIFYLPVWLEIYQPRYFSQVLEILKAASLVVAVKVLLVFHLFSQNYNSFDLNNLYKWIRDTRTGEITPFGNNFSRVFFQAHFYLLVAWFLLFFRQLKDFWNKQNFLILIFVSIALFISLSRSLWLGGGLAFLFLLVYIFLSNKKLLLSALLLSIFLCLTSLLTIGVFFNLPKFNSLNIFQQRSLDLGEPALSSRQQLLGPLWQEIKQSPFLGHGFGKELTYQSSDPRIKNENNPEGWYTSYAFEWGWLDIWLKGGLFFLLLFIVWLSLIFIRAYNSFKRANFSALFLLPAVFSLIIVHFFSPYINHPLGLGLLIFSSIVFSVYE